MLVCKALFASSSECSIGIAIHNIEINKFCRVVKASKTSYSDISTLTLRHTFILFYFPEVSEFHV